MKRKPDTDEALLIIVVWLTALALAYLVYIKLKVLF
jgi:hypothetical protein